MQEPKRQLVREYHDHFKKVIKLQGQLLLLDKDERLKQYDQIIDQMHVEIQDLSQTINNIDDAFTQINPYILEQNLKGIVAEERMKNSYNNDDKFLHAGGVLFREEDDKMFIPGESGFMGGGQNISVRSQQRSAEYPLFNPWQEHLGGLFIEQQPLNMSHIASEVLRRQSDDERMQNELIENIDNTQENDYKSQRLHQFQQDNIRILQSNKEKVKQQLHYEFEQLRSKLQNKLEEQQKTMSLVDQYLNKNDV